MTEKEVKQVPYMSGLFTWPSDKPQLIGGHCEACGSYWFPRFNVIHKPGCKELKNEEHHFSPRGKVETFTIQHYPAAPPFINPEPFAPYAVGWIALPEGICVGGVMTGVKNEDMKLGMEVEMVVEAQGKDENGNDALIWKWRPV